MESYLTQLKDIRKKYNVPCVIAGDVFHKWNSPPRLINFAMPLLQGCYAIPGQHDLPYHRYEDIKMSAYWTLVEAQVLKPLDPGKMHQLGKLNVRVFPWNFDIQPPASYTNKRLNVAICHKYIWQVGHNYPDAPKENHVDEIRKTLLGYNVAFFGDNHKGFIDRAFEECTICNCGSFIRRNSDEATYQPYISLLMSDGKVSRHYLDTSEDKIAITVQKMKKADLNAVAFLKAVQNMDVEDFDFKEYLLRLITTNERKITKPVRQIILSLLEEINGR